MEKDAEKSKPILFVVNIDPMHRNTSNDFCIRRLCPQLEARSRNRTSTYLSPKKHNNQLIGNHILTSNIQALDQLHPCRLVHVNDHHQITYMPRNQEYQMHDMNREHVITVQ